MEGAELQSVTKNLGVLGDWANGAELMYKGIRYSIKISRNEHKSSETMTGQDKHTPLTKQVVEHLGFTSPNLFEMHGF